MSYNTSIQADRQTAFLLLLNNFNQRASSRVIRRMLMTSAIFKLALFVGILLPLHTSLLNIHQQSSHRDVVLFVDSLRQALFPGQFGSQLSGEMTDNLIHHRKFSKRIVHVNKMPEFCLSTSMRLCGVPRYVVIGLLYYLHSVIPAFSPTDNPIRRHEAISEVSKWMLYDSFLEETASPSWTFWEHEGASIVMGILAVNISLLLKELLDPKRKQITQRSIQNFGIRSKAATLDGLFFFGLLPVVGELFNMAIPSEISHMDPFIDSIIEGYEEEINCIIEGVEEEYIDNQ